MGLFDGELKLSKLPSKFQNKPEYKHYLYSPPVSSPTQNNIASPSSKTVSASNKDSKENNTVTLGGLVY